MGTFPPADIDECLSASCEGLCVNTEGGFVCECGPGMQLSADRHSCQGECDWEYRRGEGWSWNIFREDVKDWFIFVGQTILAFASSILLLDTDECLATPCQHHCKNSMGSYRCSCHSGFYLHGNQHSCVGRCPYFCCIT